MNSSTQKTPKFGAWCFLPLGLFTFTSGSVEAQSVLLDTHDATVWSQSQTVEGRITEAGPAGVMYLDGEEIPFEASADSFSVPIRLGPGSHSIVACDAGGEPQICSDTLRLSLGFNPRPEVYAWADVVGGEVRLHAVTVGDSLKGPVSFRWMPDPENPSQPPITSQTDSVTFVNLSPGDPDGEYYFDVEVKDGDGSIGRARTFVTVTDSTIAPFNIWTDHAAWIDSAIVYEVTPYNFVAGGGLQEIRERLSELVDLGINTLWIQPIFETYFGGQGYDVTNYFAIRPDYGSAGTLHTLITVAHNLGLKVILDFVPNHTSIHHPYAKDAIAYGQRSHYFDFYQRKLDDARYSGDYHQRVDGRMTFTYYFWTDLVNLNYDNPEVQRWMTEAGQYWIEEFDVDGYRIDAVWGVNARTPSAMQEWRFDLKRIKPEILLLGEDKATRAEAFDRRFDVAFDWYPEESWVSHWTWQYDYSPSTSRTIFNHPNLNARSRLLRDALTNHGDDWAPNAKVLRFMENNDTFRFAATHSPNSTERTRMASTLLFTLPGLPLLYNGQEIGFPEHPYDTYAIFDGGRSLARQDRMGLFPHYRYLAHVRRRFRVLSLGDFREIEVAPSNASNRVFSFLRSYQQEHALVAINMGDRTESVSLDLNLSNLTMPVADNYYLSSLTTGEHFPIAAADPGPISIELAPYSTDVFIISDRIVGVSLPTSTKPISEVAGNLEVDVYPNPFTSETTVRFNVEQSGRTFVAIYDILGRLVQTVIDRDVAPGSYQIPVDASRLSPGAYLFRLETGGVVKSGAMIKSQ